jgi:hypothetical protein
MEGKGPDWVIWQKVTGCEYPGLEPSDRPTMTAVGKARTRDDPGEHLVEDRKRL